MKNHLLIMVSCEWLNKMKADTYQDVGASYPTTEMCRKKLIKNTYLRSHGIYFN